MPLSTILGCLPVPVCVKSLLVPLWSYQVVTKQVTPLQKVSKALTSVNLQCEDCDDRDLDKVLLAKSLLESLENLWYLKMGTYQGL